MGILRITMGGDPERWRQVIGHPIEIKMFGSTPATIAGTIVDVETNDSGQAVVVIEGRIVGED